MADRQAEPLRGLEVDHELDLRGLLHGQLGSVGPSEEPVQGATFYVAPSRRCRT
jgi:hypothetical protein